MNRSNIPYLTHVWNPTTGCSPVSAGCAGCWAAAYHKRWRKDFAPTVHPEKLDEPLRLRKPAVIGVSFLGDLFHDDVPMDFIRKVRDVIACSPEHTFILLTKRPERMREFTLSDAPRLMWPPAMETEDGVTIGGAQVWLGVSVENQATADARIPVLLDTPAAHRFVSLEPQIGAVDLSRVRLPSSLASRPGEWNVNVLTDQDDENFHNDHARLDLVIQGCESGPRRRPFDVAWARSVRDQCKAAGVPYYFKQAPGVHFKGDGWPSKDVVEKPFLDGRQHLDLPWTVKP